MQNETALGRSEYDWQRCRVALPFVGLLLDRHGAHTRLIWPGAYLVRRSRTFNRLIYRRPFP